MQVSKVVFSSSGKNLAPNHGWQQWNCLLYFARQPEIMMTNPCPVRLLCLGDKPAVSFSSQRPGFLEDQPEQGRWEPCRAVVEVRIKCNSVTKAVGKLKSAEQQKEVLFFLDGGFQGMFKSFVGPYTIWKIYKNKEERPIKK